MNFVRRARTPVFQAVVLLRIFVCSTDMEAVRTWESVQQVHSQPSEHEDQTNSTKKANSKSKRASADAASATDFSEAVAEAVIRQLAAALGDHNQHRFLAAFDSEKMDGYLNFQNQVEALFENYDSFRLHFRLVQASMENGHATAIANFELEEIPRSPGSLPARKSEQLRFEMERGSKAWKIVELSPRSFFS